MLVTRIEDLKQRRNGMGARPNVYKRSLEARENTNAYLAEVERKAAGVDVDGAIAAENKRTAKDLYRAVGYALLILCGIWLAVGMVVL